MQTPQYISVFLSIVFFAIMGYGVYLMQLNATLQRNQQEQINRALLDAIGRSQKSVELSTDALQKLAEIVYLLHTELSTSQKLQASDTPTTTVVVPVAPEHPTTSETVTTPDVDKAGGEGG